MTFRSAVLRRDVKMGRMRVLWLSFVASCLLALSSCGSGDSAQVLRFSDWHTAPALAAQAYAQGADGVAIYESNQVVTLPDYRDRLHLLKDAPT